MKMKSWLLLGIMISALWASACSSTNPPPTQATQPPDNGYPISANGYPLDNEEGPNTGVANSAYPGVGYPAPGEQSLVPTPGVPPNPDAASGVVVGKVLFKGKQIRNSASLYLAEIIQDEKKLESVAAFDPANSPRAFMAEDGSFVFANIAPGEYGLVLDFVVTNMMLGQLNGNGPILLKVEAGKTTDLGTLDYPDLPIPPQ